MATDTWIGSTNYELLCAGLDPPRAPPARCRELCISAADGVALAASLYQPAAGGADLAILINGATGVRRGYYRHFAEHLAAAGCVVLCYDYRGIGGSRDAGRGARMLDWGERDIAGALEWLLRRYPTLPLAAIGHSAGGWLFGLADNNRSADALLTIGSQKGHWRYWPTLRGKAFMWATMNLSIPLLTHLLGRLPGAVFGGDSLPAGVALDWARWCRHPDFLVDDDGVPLRKHFHDYEGPARLLAISDDDYAPEQAVHALAQMYAQAAAEVRLLRPQDLGLRHLGHFGYFRKQAPHALWDEALAWLRRSVMR